MRNKNILFYPCFVAILAFIPCKNLFSQRIPSEKPKLVIAIVVDQMKYNYMNLYWDSFGENGFKKLATEGAFCKNARFNYLHTQAATGQATISTGTVPTYHGIISDYWYDRMKEEEVFCVADFDYESIGGSYGTGNMSPNKLLSTTIGDELRMSTTNKSKLYGVSMDASSSILSTGHNANSCFWYDQGRGKWITSSYYQDTLNGWIKDFNNKMLPDIYLDRIWKPITNVAQLNQQVSAQPEDLKGKFMEFAHDLSNFIKKDKKYRALQSTPFGNTFTFDFSKALILYEDLGKDSITDYISINFCSNGQISRKYGQDSPELADAYIRLDRELSQFLEFVDNRIGHENTLVYLTADRGASFDPEYLNDYRIPADYFNANQSMALLKSYLNVVYGKGKWIKYYYMGQIYLNRQLIESSDIKLEEFQTTVAQFMIQFSGIANAVSATALQNSNFSTGIYNKFQNTYNQNRSGDVLINLEPGWVEKGDNLTSTNSSYSYDTHVPLIWYGWKIKRASISKPVAMVDVAATLSSLLEIPYTNACLGNPIVDIVD